MKGPHTSRAHVLAVFPGWFLLGAPGHDGGEADVRDSEGLFLKWHEEPESTRAEAVTEWAGVNSCTESM